MIVAPNSPRPRAKESAAAAPKPLCGERQHHPGERARRPGAERTGGVQQRLVERLEGRDRSANVEGTCDVGDGEDDGSLREAHCHPQRLERPRRVGLADRTPPGARVRRQRAEERAGTDQRDRKRTSAKASTRDEVGGRGSDEKDERLRDRIRLERDERARRRQPRTRTAAPTRSPSGTRRKIATSGSTREGQHERRRARRA